MRLKQKERPNSAQAPKTSQLASPGVPALHVPNRAMSVNVRPPYSSREQAQTIRAKEQKYASYSQSSSLSQAQRPPINPEVLRLQEWPGDGERSWERERGVVWVVYGHAETLGVVWGGGNLVL